MTHANSHFQKPKGYFLYPIFGMHGLYGEHIAQYSKDVIQFYISCIIKHEISQLGRSTLESILRTCNYWYCQFSSTLGTGKTLIITYIVDVLVNDLSIKSLIYRYLGDYFSLLNDREFWLILLIRDWPRHAFLDRTSEWVHRKCLTTVYSGCLWCHNENADFRVKFLLGLASLVCIFLWRHNIRTSFHADF